MQSINWLAAMSARLQQRWPSVDPVRLDDLALDLSRDAALRAMPPERAAEAWLEPVTRDAESDPDNGMLAAVPGEYVSKASKALPDPSTATADALSATIDAGHAGRVRIDYRRTRFKRHRATWWSWVAVRAERIVGG